jgi:hypothetical protein
VDSSALLLKKTYRDLTATELEKISGIVNSMVDAANEKEKKALESSIEKLQKKLKNL